MNTITDISYCCVSSDTLEISALVKAWIQAKQNAGWKVEFSIRKDGDVFGVMWQCISHPDHPYAEFTDCISMTGREFRMN